MKYPYLLFFLHFALYLTLHPYGNCWTENVQWSWTMLLRVLGQSSVLKNGFHPISFLNGLFEIVTISKHLLCLFSKQCTWIFFSRTIIYPKSVSISRGGLLIYFNKLFLQFISQSGILFCLNLAEHILYEALISNLYSSFSYIIQLIND